MGIYLTNPSKTEYGKRSYREEFQSDNLVTFNRIQEENERMNAASKEQKRFVIAEMAARRLARRAHRENNNMRLEEVAKFDRVHLKRELKAEDLNAFIETME